MGFLRRDLRESRREEKVKMTSAASATVVKMIDSLPEPVQERVVEHLQDYIADVRDEMKWNESFAKSQDKLVAAAKKAREEIAQGLATPLDLEQL
jgi:alpha/beta superfamily hydrolase